MDKKALKEVFIYSDGAAVPNPGSGGWGVLLIHRVGGKEYRKEIYGGFRNTTNNRMELYAVIKGLSVLKESCKVYLHTDSKYVTNPFNLGWIVNWQRKGWKEVKNADLWKELLELSLKHQVEWRWVKGHNGHLEQEYSDYLADLGLKEKDLLIDFVYEHEVELAKEELIVQESLLIA